ncbi:MAG: hemerythrin domain-containing protein [Alistipes sp.]|nr:hemerythrin domain-containing protein [Alistipes sp.]
MKQRGTKLPEQTSSVRMMSENMKLAELLESDYKLLSILSRLGIRLGFGEMSVGEMCRKYNLSAELFLLICRIYASPGGYVPSPDHLAMADLRDITSYLHRSHVYYSETVIPRLGQKIEEMMDSCDAIHRKILNTFFSDYCSEVANHFEYEECTVFPYVESLLAGENPKSSGYSIEKFEDNHSDIDAKRSDLKSIIIKYLPESCPAELRNDVLFEIFRFEEDLSKHTEIENFVLIPLVEKLEGNG